MPEGMVWRLGEKQSLVHTVGGYVPVGRNEWLRVENDHREHFPEQDRDLTAIRRVFREIGSMAAPTGQTEMPDYVYEVWCRKYDSTRYWCKRSTSYVKYRRIRRKKLDIQEYNQTSTNIANSKETRVLQIFTC